MSYVNRKRFPCPAPLSPRYNLFANLPLYAVILIVYAIVNFLVWSMASQTCSKREVEVLVRMQILITIRFQSPKHYEQMPMPGRVRVSN